MTTRLKACQSMAVLLLASLMLGSLAGPTEAYAASPLDLDATPEQQYYLYGPEWHGANALDAWDALEKAGVKAQNQVGVAVLDTGVYVMREASERAEASRAYKLDPSCFHQEFDEGNLDTANGGDFIHVDKTSSDSFRRVRRPLASAYVDGMGGTPVGDDSGHGTHIAGIIGARATLAGSDKALPLGMAGVSPYACLVPCKVLDANEDGELDIIIQAYKYLLAAKKSGGLANLHVVNMSLAVTEGVDEDLGEDGEVEEGVVNDDDPESAEADDPEAETAKWEELHGLVRQAAELGIITICAAGNEASAAFTRPGDFEECLCVAALDADGRETDFSNANEHKDISAPGVDIYSAWAQQADSYAIQSGTSQACAIVSGVASMLWAANPNLTVEQAREALLNTARLVEGASESNGSYGSVDAAAAVAYVLAGEYRGLADNPRNSLSASFDAGDENGPGGHGDVEGDVDPDSASDSPGDDASNESDAGRDSDTKAASRALDEATFGLSPVTCIYTGKPCKPIPTLVLDGEELVRGVDYTVAYKDNVNPGKASAIVAGKGAYKGKRTKAFSIKLAKVLLSKPKAAGRTITVKWKRQKSGNVGYQVRYSLKKSMKGAKVRTVKSNKKTSLKLKKLKRGKRYYVQVRSFKRIGKAVKHSAWSAKKSVKAR